MARPAQAPFRDDRHRGPELQICPACAVHLVYPVAWQPAGGRCCMVSLRCPNCEWTRTDVFDEAAMERFDDALDRGTDALVADLRQIAYANMEEDVERLAAAIWAGLVLPEDF